MTADQVTTAAEHVGWVEFVTADDAATTHIAYVHEDGSVYLPEGHDVVTWEVFRLTAATDRFWPLVRRPDRPAPQVDEGVEDVLNRWSTGPAIAQMVVAEVRAALAAARGGEDGKSRLTLREEFLYRIRTALAYGLMRGKHGEAVEEGWAEREADLALAARGIEVTR